MSAVSKGEAQTPAEVISRARALAPKLRGYAEGAEKNRRISDEAMADIVDMGIQRICQPRRFGGYELEWRTLCASLMELAKGDSSHAWVACVFGEHSCYTALFSDEAQHDVWGDNPDALVSSSYTPFGKVETVDGGYRLSGQWHWSSGIHHASYLLVGGMLPNEDGSGQGLTMFLVPAKEATIIDDWHVLGMAATGSCSFTLDDVFVPAHRVLNEDLVFQGKTPGSEVNSHWLYRMPQRGISQSSLVSVPLGAALGAAEEYEERVRTGTSPMLGPLVELPTQQLRLAEASGATEAARRLVLDRLEAVNQKLASGGYIEPGDLALALRDCGYAAKLVRQAINIIFEASGATGTRLDNHLQRTFRDVHCAANHLALGWDFSATNFAKLKFGLADSH